MRGFVVLGFIAVALARPEGYNYAHPIVNAPFFPSFGNGIGSQSLQQFSGGASLQSSHGIGAGVSSFGFSSPSFAPTVLNHGHVGTLSHGYAASTVAPPVHHAPLIHNVGTASHGFTASNVAPHVYHAPLVHNVAPVHHAPIVTKHFHSFAAPEEPEEEARHELINLGPGHKHYRVIFIKAPHHNAHNAALTIAQAANEEKTIIYVLSKKPDAAEIHTAIKEAHSVPTKPEVFFIKYKTHAEAEHAQHVIQSQYDALGGSTKVSDEGIAPLTSVVGALGPVGGSAVSVSPSPIYPTPLAPVIGPTYLPPK